MISDAEVRREARRAGVQPSIIDLDYVLGWVLFGLGSHSYLRQRLLFKGGTCLHKCYFPEYRFSEDLDFTVTKEGPWRDFEMAVIDSLAEVSARVGIDFAVHPPRSEVLPVGDHGESLQMRIYFQGPHPTGGAARAIRLDLTGSETVVFDPVTKSIVHPYSDAPEMQEARWDCYSLEEMAAEKVRALLGQRRYAISRDLYDVHALQKRGVGPDKIRDALPVKLAVKKLQTAVDIGSMVSRRAEFEADWNRNLVPVLPPTEQVDFGAVWQEVVDFMEAVLAR